MIKPALLSLALTGLLFLPLAWAQWQPPVNLGPNINTGLEDKGPDVTHGGKQLYFWSFVSGSGHDLFVSDWDSINGEWGPRRNLGAPVNTSANEIGPCISADGRRLYFVSDRPGGYGRYDIWVARWNGNAWDSVANLGPNINDGGNDIGPDVSRDGDTLYFSIGWNSPPYDEGIVSSTCAGGQWTPRADWTQNSTAIEDNPNLSYDGTKLYFCSDRSGGSGLLDIWVSEKVSGLWQTPVNLGPVVNTSEMDANPSISDDGQMLYFSTRERPGGHGDWDVWSSRWSGVGKEEEGEASHSGVELFQIQPNPFSHDATITYSLPKSGRVTLKAYTFTGQVAVTLFEGYTQAGGHIIAWDASDLAAGVYFLRLSCDRETVTRRVVLTR